MTTPTIALADLDRLLDAVGGLRSAYQPIVDLPSGRVVAYEALARFGAGLSPAAVFGQARATGLGLELEAAAIDSALRAGRPPGGASLTINLSPSAVASPLVRERLPQDLEGIIIEVTENETVRRGGDALAPLVELRRRGALVAIDDAGAGCASLRQVMLVRPDIIKVDRDLTAGCDQDPARRALLAAFVDCAEAIGAIVCAEGLERPEELAVVTELGVRLGQGFILGRPERAWARAEAPAAMAA